MSLKKGGADRQVIKALRFLLATPEELQNTEQAGQSTGQWLSDILEYRQMPTAMTPFDYITLSDDTELRVQQVSALSEIRKPSIPVVTGCAWLCRKCIMLPVDCAHGSSVHGMHGRGGSY